MKSISRTRATKGTTMDEFVLRALLGGLALAVALGPLGCFTVWRHMAYFGDTIAHAALLGVALSLISGVVPLTLSIFIVSVGVALILYRFGGDKRFHADTVLGILAHGTLALGVLLVALTRNVRVDINAYLFGDVLTMDWTDVIVLAALCVAILLLLRTAWRPLLMVTIHPGIAHVEGIHVKRTQMLLVIMLAAIIAVSIKLVGVLLITALLIMPAASARYVATTPLRMAILASAIGAFCVSAGLGASLAIDAPTGPVMVVIAAFVFVILGAVTRLRAH